jgi:APA family basic amino acid/polyamine antiporter
MVICGLMIVSLDRQTQLTALAWMLIGFLVYFLYGRTHSKLAVDPAAKPSVGASV